ncbi:putative hydro-lyase [Corynebacterium alimapuense]|uniref:Putative hydro-lyase C5L39_07970 n=1 Tax=Corynebacterium alimapuense TaxID=1576874 RepID=A0A3M8K5D1_9CORY|nr:putative hydro-lyase [Corynebacterium alimapuense]RNE48437.1 putative hydro-lyase [Corynebacterium alimapuense]
MTTELNNRAGLSPSQARELFRAGTVVPTSGFSHGFAQANLLSLPKEDAFDFLLFAQRNPKPCPLLGVLEPGQVSSELLNGGDIRTDIPAYRLFRDGELVEEATDATAWWREDMVSFLIGCSFTFEAALLDNGVPVAHIAQERNVPMYRTTIQTNPAGRFAGPLVVSMRPIPAGQVADAVRITSRYPAVHGAPVHVGDPAAIGIEDLGAPDFGESVAIAEGEIPVFWACGVTPQAVVMDSRPTLAISHSPGHMLVTDARDLAYQVP